MKTFCEFDTAVVAMRTNQAKLFVTCEDGTRWVVDDKGNKSQILISISDIKSMDHARKKET